MVAAGHRVEAYWNLHKQCVSFRRPNGRVQHAETLALRDVTFSVQPAGQARVRREHRKTVHAFVRGVVEAVNVTVPDDAVEVTYNPYEHSGFVVAPTGDVVTHAERVVIAGKRVWLVG